MHDRRDSDESRLEGQLRAATRHLSDENVRLETVLDSVSAGVVICDD